VIGDCLLGDLWAQASAESTDLALEEVDRTTVFAKVGSSSQIFGKLDLGSDAAIHAVWFGYAAHFLRCFKKGSANESVLALSFVPCRTRANRGRGLAWLYLPGDDANIVRPAQAFFVKDLIHNQVVARQFQKRLDCRFDRFGGRYGGIFVVQVIRNR